MRKRKDIDALRALAIIGVVLYHVGLPGFRNGYIDVDIFCCKWLSCTGLCSKFC